MNLTIKYALTIACLGFILMVLPGAVSVACGCPLLYASSGLALGVIFCVKGKIASKIFGSDNYRSSAPGWATAIFALTGFKAFTAIFSTISYIKVFGYEPVDKSYLAGQYVGILVASVIYAFIIFVSILLRSKFRKPDVQKIDSI